MEGKDCKDAWHLGQRVWGWMKRWEDVVTLTAVKQERSGNKRPWYEDDHVADDNSVTLFGGGVGH